MSAARLARLTARQLEALLHDQGFEMVSQRGSHRKWRRQSDGRQVIVPDHKGKVLPIGTLQSILKGAGATEDGES